MMTSWCNCFPRYNVLAVLALKKQKMCWIFGVRLKSISLVIIDNIAFYDQSWNKFLSYTNIQQNFYLFVPGKTDKNKYNLSTKWPRCLNRKKRYCHSLLSAFTFINDRLTFCACFPYLQCDKVIFYLQ